IAVQFDDAQPVAAVEYYHLGLGEGCAVDLHVQRFAGQLVKGDYAAHVNRHQVLQGDFAGADFQGDMHRNLAEEAQVLLRQALRLGGFGKGGKRLGIVEAQFAIADQGVQVAVRQMSGHGFFTLSREVRNRLPLSSKMLPRNSGCWLMQTSTGSCRRATRMSPGRSASTSARLICSEASTQSRRTGSCRIWSRDRKSVV